MTPRILIVEDDEPTQRLLQALLTRFGSQSETASNGSAAIECLQRDEFAAVVLDMMMPEVSGVDVIEFLAAQENATPVIVCTAAGPSVLRDLNRDVVKAVVRKPFDVEEFAATLERVAERRRPAG